MCERFYLTATAAEIAKRLKLDRVPALAPRYNIAPTQFSPIVIAAEEGRQLHVARWGLVPSWSRDLSLGTRMINVPGETVDDKAATRTLFHTHRALVPASGFYEWQVKAARKQPYRICLRGGALFAFAGLWELWAPEDAEPVHTFTIITTRPNKLVGEVHDRMPVIIAPTDYQRWLTGSVQVAKRLLVPYTGGMTIAPVSDRVNNTKDDDVGLIAPIA